MKRWRNNMGKEEKDWKEDLVCEKCGCKETYFIVEENHRSILNINCKNCDNKIQQFDIMP